jgi:N-methylhydantoinase B
MHQEGLVFPGTKIFKAGEPNREILELIRFNSRMPEAVMGDLNAQVAALRTGERRLLELIEKFGEATLDSAVAAILDHGERATLRALAALPHGTWCAEDYLDDDGISDDPLLMRCTVTIASDRFEVDFSGSHGTARGPVNSPFGATIAICKVALKALTSPHEATNAGQTRPLRVHAEPGNLFHAVYPAPTYTLWTGSVALELIFKAIAQGMPDRLPASSGGEMAGYMLVGAHADDGRLFAISNGEAVGWGATPHHDGADATSHVATSVLRTASIEVLETKTTMFVERVELRTDTGGAGRFRGGVGVQRDIRFLAPGDFLTVGKKTKTRPWAIAGGLETEPNTFVLFPETERERRVQTQRTPVDPGDRFRVLTAGGGGHGDPRDRDPAHVREDVLDGYVSPEAAREVYGVSADTSTA